MREKLERLGLKLPLLPTTTVGSFPKPPYLIEARRKFADKKLTAEELEKLEEQVTREWIELQEKIGLDVLVDGEIYRGDMVRGKVAEADHRGLVAICPRTHQQTCQGNGHWALHDDGLVVQRVLPESPRGLLGSGESFT